MKRFFTLVLISICFTGAAQSVCGTVAENGTLTLTAPTGMKFNSIIFASYGTPTGSCGSFAVSSCNAASSVSKVSAALIGNNSGSIVASNTVFTDPCSGTVKKLSVQAGYTAALPLTLISFSAKKIDAGSVQLQWLTNTEINTSYFSVEKSNDGISFDAAGRVAAKGGSVNNYSFTASPANSNIIYYRLKMVDQDGRFTYSNVLRINNAQGALVLSVFPNPAKNAITISGLAQTGQIRLLNASGELLQQINTTAQTLTMDISRYRRGVYVLQYISDRHTVSQRLLNNKYCN